jgi:SAM-dependent methyltransferase/uncharacterized protein YbaR (Trm112 family)
LRDGPAVTYETVLSLLCCPACKRPLAPAGNGLQCTDPACGKAFPIVDGRPVLIDEARSVFSHADYRDAQNPTNTPPDSLREWVRRLPSPSVNLSAVRAFETMGRRLASRESPLVLVVGGGLSGKGMHALTSVPTLRIINVDPSPNSAAVLFCDGHDLPFADASIDAVVVQAVLEHVADPFRCVDEIHRVLKPDGLVYSETPFMQQVHLKGYDFTRFTHIGHRRLFRWFTEIESGVVAGPGTALAWSWRYFLASLAPARYAKLAAGAGRVMGFALEQFDYLLRQRPGALDGASATYFLGARSTVAASDREVLVGYRGVQ